MRLDPDTGALASSAWRIDPLEPRSSFEQWADGAGFKGRYYAEADGWFVNVFFDIGGVLRRISMSGPDQEEWVRRQRWQGRVYTSVNPHEHESSVHIEYDTVATKGPPPEPGDLDLVARAARLDLASTSAEYLAFERLWRAPPSDDALAEVLRTGTAAGRCYAAHLNPDAWAALLGDSSPLSVEGGLTTVAAYARRWVA
jgi:hypothetical protein